MNLTQLLALSPLWILALTATGLLFILAFHRSHRLTCSLTLAALLIAVGAALMLRHGPPLEVTRLLVIDRFAVFYIILLLLDAAVVALLAFGYLERDGIQPDEFHILLLLAVFGCVVLVCATHFASFFLGLEILSVALYAMIAYTRTRERAVEAALKYLILAGTSSAFLLFGLALIYAALGTMRLDAVAHAAVTTRDLWLRAGLGLIVVGAGFKLAVVPFHMWTPDVYEGAPAPVAAFIATASKGAMFALLLRAFGPLGAGKHQAFDALLTFIAIASMFGGNLLALMQDNVKRILAYSSISHLGYLIVAFLAGSTIGAEAATIYLVAYFITTLAAFGVVAALSPAGRDFDQVGDYRGLFWRRPWLAGILAASLFSLAGIPVTAGFVGKFYVLTAGGRAGLWTLLILLVTSSVIGLFYYLRVIVALVDRTPARADEEPAGAGPVAVTGGLALGAMLVLLILWGVYPGPLIGWIRAATIGMF